MITNDIIQAGIISRLKALTAVTDLVGSEIRERSWRGTDFSYPAIRVAMSPSSPSLEGCEYSEILFIVAIFSENKSSLESLQIQSAVMNNMPTSFEYSSGGETYLFSGVRVDRGGMGSPIPIDIRTWQNELNYRAIVSKG